MNKQSIDQQIDFVRRELTRISHEVHYLEGTQLQTLRVRQSRLAAELDRLEGLRRNGPAAVPAMSFNGQSTPIGYQA
ncbi:MAG: hypothetical protein M1546_23305 [Chloroflexi bacterium]|nr:hypothetical protein [Chloroflexota bacterium]